MNTLCIFGEKNMKTLFRFAAPALCAVMAALPAASAALITTNDQLADTITLNSQDGKGFREAIVDIVDYFLSFAGLLAVIFIVYAGVLMIQAQGEDEDTEKGKKILTWAVLGLLVIMLSYAIVRMVVSASGSA